MQPATQATTAGSYTFSVTATDAANSKLTTSANVIALCNSRIRNLIESNSRRSRHVFTAIWPCAGKNVLTHALSERGPWRVFI